ncbi:MAG TPA: hypothetical protein VKU39_03065 [Streptosporangiaceae bacterium]|nr:hypothetical protein [Streptosporangiaceae bacterium]
MNDADSTQDHGVTTEQIAAAGVGPGRPDALAQAGREDHDDSGPAPLVAGNEVPGRPGRGALEDGDSGRAAADPGPGASLLEDGELQGMVARWKDIQAEFVDEPRKAIQEADALVAELMQRLAAMFAGERAELEQRLAGDSRVSTEDLRQGLRRYHSFFERLLAA